MISKYSHPYTGSGIVGEPYHFNRPQQADFMATAIMTKAALIMGDVNRAREAGDSLLRALAANRRYMASGSFCLRWTWNSGFAQEVDALHSVRQTGRGQLHDMLGFPAAVLSELSDATAEAKYQDAALELLTFLRACEGIHASVSAYHVVMAAAQAKEMRLSMLILDNLISSQSRSFGSRAPLNAKEVDQTAELLILYLQVSKLQDSGSKLDFTDMSGSPQAMTNVLPPQGSAYSFQDFTVREADRLQRGESDDDDFINTDIPYERRWPDTLVTQGIEQTRMIIKRPPLIAL